ncbi:solute carrier family 49 member 4 homolog isoform X1 [Lineus longissimus]|uniref:solute carrier family 49 member 4 homolog isoform X1 n=1 Tax=Lineus longissimus TaxID=88925 RepID=UPI002B4F280A
MDNTSSENERLLPAVCNLYNESVVETEAAVNFGTIQVANGSLSQTPPYNNNSGSTNASQSFKGDVHVYKRRWYILAVFSLFSFTQGLIWNAWGPIAGSSEAVFDWQNPQIALFANWGCITYLVVVPFTSWLMEEKGLRPALLWSSFLVALGGAIRCITFHLPYVTWLANAGAFLNGAAGPVAMAASPVLSSVWFPPDERTTATAVSSTLNYMGVALSFVVGPAIVKDLLPGNVTNASVPMTNVVNDSIPYVTNLTTLLPDVNRSTASVPTKPTLLPLSNATVPSYIDKMKFEIEIYTYIQAGVAIFLFFLILLYFPSRPKMPPSVSAATDRVDFKSGIKSLLKKPNFFLIITAYSLAIGIFGPWMSVLIVNVISRGIAQAEAGWLGFFSTIAGCVVGFAIARLADVISRHMKMFLIVMFTLSTLMFVWFTLICEGWIPFSTVQIYVSCITGCALVGGSIPLFYELGCETAYPVAESVAAGVQTFLLNVVGFLFLILFYIPNIGTDWLNWVMLGSVAAGIPMLALYKEQYTRLEIDSLETTSTDNDVQI